MPRTAALTPQMISDFCRLRLANHLDAGEQEAIKQYLVDLLELMAFPPYRGKWVEWVEVAAASGIDKDRLVAAKHQLQPVFDAVSRSVAIHSQPLKQKMPRSPRSAFGRVGKPALREVSISDLVSGSDDLASLVDSFRQGISL